MNPMNPARHRLVVLTLCCAALSPVPLMAQQASKKADPAVARQAELIRKLQSSENELKEANTKLTQEKSAADEALAAANKGRAAEAARTKAEQTQASALRRQLSDKQEALAKLERELEQSRRELEQSRRDVRDDRARVTCNCVNVEARTRHSQASPMTGCPRSTRRAMARRSSARNRSLVTSASGSNHSSRNTATRWTIDGAI